MPGIRGPLIFYRVETSGVEYCLNPVTLSIVCADISTGLGRLNSAEIVALAATVKNTVKQRDTICTTAVPTGSAVTLMYLPRMVINRIAKIKKAVARMRGINYEILMLDFLKDMDLILTLRTIFLLSVIPSFMCCSE